MEKINFIYDDTTKVDDRSSTIIGQNTFGEMILKRKKLYEYTKNEVIKCNADFYKITTKKDYQNLKQLEDNNIYFHILSIAAINDSEEFGLIMEKSKYIKEVTAVMQDELVALIFPDKASYMKFLDKYLINNKFDSIGINNVISANCFTNIGVYNNLLMYISSGFDARYFNSLQGDDYSITKRSRDKKKMQMEYKYYWLLPDDMKNWMVMPFDFKEEKDYASYSMERMPMTDIAIRWTHGAVRLEEMEKILDKIFYFFSIRHEKEISKDEFIKISDELYLNKLLNRIKDLKKYEQYDIFASYIKNGTEYRSIDDIVDEYINLYKQTINAYCKQAKKFKSVIGHGDVFFANMLYSKEINLLRLIDPKGALTEEDLWTNPFYDIAKLSHSICGNYDFFNANLYDISLDNNMNFKLEIHFDNTKYKEKFKQYLKLNNYDYKMIRVYEISLFLSMLPLHIDNPHKVFGYLLNAINIIKEIEDDV